MIKKFIIWLIEPIAKDLRASKEMWQEMIESHKHFEKELENARMPEGKSKQIQEKERKQRQADIEKMLFTTKCLYCGSTLRKGSTKLYCKKCEQEHLEEIRQRKTYLFSS